MIGSANQPKEATNHNAIQDNQVTQQPIRIRSSQPAQVQPVGTLKVTQQLQPQFVQFAPGVNANQPIANQSISIGSSNAQPTQTIRILNESEIQQDPTIELVEINQIDEKNQYQVFQQQPNQIVSNWLPQ